MYTIKVIKYIFYLITKSDKQKGTLKLQKIPFPACMSGFVPPPHNLHWRWSDRMHVGPIYFACECRRGYGGGSGPPPLSAESYRPNILLKLYKNR